MTLMAENIEELKSLMMRVKEKSGKAGLKFNILKTNIMASFFFYNKFCKTPDDFRRSNNVLVGECDTFKQKHGATISK